MTRRPSVIHPLLDRQSSDEYDPLPWSNVHQRVVAAQVGRTAEIAARLGDDARLFAGHDRRGTATALRAVDTVHGGGFYDIDPEAETDAEAAAAAFDADGTGRVVDVQTHLANPDRWVGAMGESMTAFLRGTDPDRWSEGVDPLRLGAAAWAGHVFGESQTSVALLTSTPGREQENILTNPEIAAVREITERYAGTGRVLTHTIVHPNLGPEELDRMAGWRETLDPAGWKAYTLWDPPELVPEGEMSTGWYLDDERIGIPFLERVRDLGPRRIAVHKGIGGPIPGFSPDGASPRDIGPAAARFPEIDFLVYHSGYDPDPVGQEGAYPGDEVDEATLTGVDRLVRSVRTAGIGPGGNVHAELGSTWFMMLRRPLEAAHVLGKLLTTLGPERIVWGTDCIWYGSPQPLIDAFRAFRIPEWMQDEFGYPALTAETRERILWRNALEVYDIDPALVEGATGPDAAWVGEASRELGRRIIGGLT